MGRVHFSASTLLTLSSHEVKPEEFFRAHFFFLYIYIYFQSMQNEAKLQCLWTKHNLFCDLLKSCHPREGQRFFLLLFCDFETTIVRYLSYCNSETKILNVQCARLTDNTLNLKNPDELESCPLALFFVNCRLPVFNFVLKRNIRIFYFFFRCHADQEKWKKNVEPSAPHRAWWNGYPLSKYGVAGGGGGARMVVCIIISHAIH